MHPIVSGQTAGDYYSNLIDQVGNDVSNATSEQEAVGLVLQQLTNQQQSISGVSLDEEATNLIIYQQAYEAAARVISTVDELNAGDHRYVYTELNMGIRVNPDMYSVILNGLQTNAQQEDQALQQVSSGQKLNSLSDNPAAAASLVNLRMQSSSDTQYLQNITSLTGSLNVADSALSSVVEALTTAQSLGVEGANGTLNAQNQQALAQQIQGIQQEILGLANTSYNGEYLFSGTATTTQPYVADASAASGVTYNGNDNTNSVEISEGQAMPINLPGSQLFSNATTNVFQSLQDLYTALNTNGNIAGATTEVQNALNYVSTQQTFYGNSVDRLNNAQTFLTQEQTQLTETESNTLDVDMATAVTDLTQTETTQQALVAGRRTDLAVEPVRLPAHAVNSPS